MFAEEKWDDGAEGPGRPGPPGKRRRRPEQCAAKPGQDREPARKRPRGRRRSGQRPDTDAAAQRPPPSAEPGAAGPGPGPGPGEAARGLSGRRRRQQKKKDRQQKDRQQKGEPPAGPGGERDPEPPVAEPAPSGRSAALRARMEARLVSARFRYINQQLYTSTSREAARLFRSDPEAFHIYHRGFARQVERWPQNPLHRIVRYLRRRPATLVVADFGCGDCTLANSVRNKVHCFDLVPLSPLVTVCDMAKVPLAAKSVDVAVFCLALMGTNLQEILEEANRVLKPGGTLMVAEVASRFEDIRAFMSAMAQLGFKSVSKDLSSPFFYLLEFTKAGPPRGRPAPGLRLLPCLYKRR